ncbi:glycosyl hydrolase [Halorubrum kocurii]|uniref:glucan endo-1,3-beta-D-glucosidase n=1 Tax=Halorubrum kocurii JCM 14978 TaxID=1230456 RepID=M0NNA8_9EURY|nr:glycosyl hydrolase [Halorubrum kocurii]EMA58654.1 glycoside hydrolase family 81 [Halorubrum kocurii JCM 14978]
MEDDSYTPIDGSRSNVRRRTWLKGLLAGGVITATGSFNASAADADIERVGAGSIARVTPGEASVPPRTIYAVDELSSPYPTNDWWTTLLWRPLSENLWIHPLAARVTEAGLAVTYPDEWQVGDAPFSWGERTDDFAESVSSPDASTGPIDPDLTVSHPHVDADVPAEVADYGDWSVTYRRSSGDASLDATLTQGSPFVYFETTGGGVDVAFEGEVSVWHERSHVLGVSVGGHHYGLFAPPGAAWEGVDGDVVSSRLDGEGYVSVALLPEASPDVLNAYRRRAYAFVTDTTVTWEYDAERSAVVTDYEFELEAKHGRADETLTALYPHQAKRTGDELSDWSYVSPRGEMPVYAGSRFTTELPYRGILPFLPDAADVPNLADHVEAVESEDTLIRDWQGDGTYWTGKNFERLLQLAPIAEQVDDGAAAERFRNAIRDELETWFSAASDGDVDERDLFWYDDVWGTLNGAPMGFGADADLNDHHFHYGYWVKAAAELARVDPQWAREEAYGGVVDLLVRDYANPDRGDSQYPLFRNFSPYAGHSWASGSGELPAGCNQESSSEAINAYAALILWGELTGDEEIRDAGIYLYTHEVHAALEYWFDIANENLPDAWPYDSAGMVWGRGYAYATWFNQDAESIHAINYLPIGGHSFYLGWNRDAASANWAELLDNDDGDETFDLGWYTDVLWEFRALSAPDEARSWYETEYAAGDFAESRAHAAHWIHTLDAVGVPDASVSADTPLYSVFRDGNVRTYVAYNAADERSDVSFSDGTELTVGPGEMATTTRAFESLPPMDGAFPRVTGSDDAGSDANTGSGGKRDERGTPTE